MAKLSAIRADTKKETEGIWVEYEVGIMLLIARAGNPKFSKLVTKLSKPHLKVLRSKNADTSDLFEKITKEACASTILIGWKNIEEEDGSTVKYSAEKALEYFNDPALHDFYQFVMMSSGDREEYRLEIAEESAKN